MQSTTPVSAVTLQTAVSQEAVLKAQGMPRHLQGNFYLGCVLQCWTLVGSSEFFSFGKSWCFEILF